MSDLKPTEKYVSDAGKLKAVFGKLLSRQKLLIPCRFSRNNRHRRTAGPCLWRGLL